MRGADGIDTRDPTTAERARDASDADARATPDQTASDAPAL